MRILLLAVFISLTIPYSAFASTIVRSGDTVSVSEDQVVEGDFYAVGGTVAISGKVVEDLMIIGGNVTVNGEVGADMAIVGGTVDVHGTIVDDLRVVGGTVVIAGDVAGNLVVVASDLKILSTATIGGDLLFFGGSADISGTIDNDILGTSEKMRIDGKVGGGVDVKTGGLVLGDRADIVNNVSYNSTHELTRAQDAKVKGKVLYTDTVPIPQKSGRNAAITLLVFLFSTLVVYLFLKPFTLKIVESAQTQSLRHFGIGFGIIFLMPITGVILLISTLGTPLGIMLLSFYVVLLCLALALVGMVTGSYVMRLTKYSSVVSVLTAVVGVIIINLLFYVPIIGPLVLTGLVILTLGIITERIIHLIRSQ